MQKLITHLVACLCGAISLSAHAQDRPNVLALSGCEAAISFVRTGSVVRDGDRKYLYFYSDGQSELYNLKEDNGETKNLIDTMPEKAAAMKGLLDAELKKHNATSPTAVPVNPSRRGRKNVRREKPNYKLSY